MNSLSLVIYLADVLPSLRGGFFVVCVIAFIIGIVASIILFCANRELIEVWVPDMDGAKRSGYVRNHPLDGWK